MQAARPHPEGQDETCRPRPALSSGQGATSPVPQQGSISCAAAETLGVHDAEYHDHVPGDGAARVNRHTHQCIRFFAVVTSSGLDDALPELR